jgi:hypothetical protein
MVDADDCGRRWVHDGSVDIVVVGGDEVHVEGDESRSARATDADAADDRVVRAAAVDGVIRCHPVPDWVISTNW